MSVIQVDAWQCDVCGHVWYTKSDEHPKACAKCKRRNWDLSTRDRIEREEKADARARQPEPGPIAKPVRKPDPKPTTTPECPRCHQTKYIIGTPGSYRCTWCSLPIV